MCDPKCDIVKLPRGMRDTALCLSEGEIALFFISSDNERSKCHYNVLHYTETVQKGWTPYIILLETY